MLPKMVDCDHISWDILWVGENIKRGISDHSGYVLSQWEKALHSNASSHWLSTYPEWSLGNMSITHCWKQEGYIHIIIYQRVWHTVQVDHAEIFSCLFWIFLPNICWNIRVSLHFAHCYLSINECWRLKCYLLNLDVVYGWYTIYDSKWLFL